MIAESVRKRIDERLAKLCFRDYKVANPKPKMRKDGTVSYNPYTLGQDSVECLDILRLCNKRDVSPEEEEQVKAYHLKYCIREVDK